MIAKWNSEQIAVRLETDERAAERRRIINKQSINFAESFIQVVGNVEIFQQLLKCGFMVIHR